MTSSDAGFLGILRVKGIFPCLNLDESIISERDVAYAKNRKQMLNSMMIK